MHGPYDVERVIRLLPMDGAPREGQQNSLSNHTMLIKSRVYSLPAMHFDVSTGQTAAALVYEYVQMILPVQRQSTQHVQMILRVPTVCETYAQIILYAQTVLWKCV